MKNLFLILSVIFSISAYLAGIISIIMGGFRPQRMTRFLLFLISILLVATSFAQGNRNTVYWMLAICIGNLIIFILSIKKGLGGTSKLDICVFFMVIISLIVWFTTKDPVVGLTLSIVTDFIAFSPTLIKSWILPETENWKVYMIEVFCSSCNLLSLSYFSFGKLVFPVYMLLINSTTTSIIFFRGRIKNKFKFNK